jgi:hypothetical protein
MTVPERCALGVGVAVGLLAAVLASRLLLLAHSTRAARDVLRYGDTGDLVIGGVQTSAAIALLIALIICPPMPREAAPTELRVGVWIVGLLVGVLVFGRAALALVVVSALLDAILTSARSIALGRRTVLCVAGAGVLLVGSGSWMPTQLVRTPGDAWVTGYILRDDAAEIVILQRRPREVVRLMPDQVIDSERPYVRELCPPSPEDAWARPLIDLTQSDGVVECDVA